MGIYVVASLKPSSLFGGWKAAEIRPIIVLHYFAIGLDTQGLREDRVGHIVKAMIIVNND